MNLSRYIYTQYKSLQYTPGDKHKNVHRSTIQNKLSGNRLSGNFPISGYRKIKWGIWSYMKYYRAVQMNGLQLYMPIWMNLYFLAVLGLSRGMWYQFPDQGLNLPLGVWSLSHWTTREAPIWMNLKQHNTMWKSKFQNLRYSDDATLMAESKEKLKSLLMKVKEESKKAGLKLSIQKVKIMAFDVIISWQIEGEKMEIVTDFIFLDSKITVNGDCSHEIKRRLLLGGKTMTNVGSILKAEIPLCQKRSI